jgi:hypothetical protein
MRIIIAGSRNVTEHEVRNAIGKCSWIGFASAIVSGGARGADKYGENWAEEQSINVYRYLADWEKYGKRAGPLRNKLMSENAEGLIAIWDGKSRGTCNMIELAKENGLRVFIFRTDVDMIEEYSASDYMGTLWDIAEERAAVKEFDANLPKHQAEREAGVEIRHKIETEQAGARQSVS